MAGVHVRAARALSEGDKMKVWIHYMVNQVAFNNNTTWTHIMPRIATIGADINKKYTPMYDKIYPVMNIGVWENKTKRKIKSFEDFCKGDDDRVVESLVGYYWRFKGEIFKSE